MPIIELKKKTMRPAVHSITRRTGQPEATTASNTQPIIHEQSEKCTTIMLLERFFLYSPRIYARIKWVCLI